MTGFDIYSPSYPVAIQQAWGEEQVGTDENGDSYFKISPLSSAIQHLPSLYVDPYVDNSAPIAATPAYRLPSGRVGQAFFKYVSVTYARRYWWEPIENPVIMGFSSYEEGWNYWRSILSYNGTVSTPVMLVEWAAAAGWIADPADSGAFFGTNVYFDYDVPSLLYHQITDGTPPEHYYELTWLLAEYSSISWLYTDYIPSGRKISNIIPLLTPLFLLAAFLPVGNIGIANTSQNTSTVGGRRRRER